MYLVRMYHNLFVHSLADRHLYHFQFLAVINNVAMNIHEQVLVFTNIFISDAGSLVSLFLLFLRKCQAVCKLDISFYIPTIKHEDSSFFLLTLRFVFLFYYKHPSGCDMIFYCGFVLHFSNDVGNLFMYVLIICIPALVNKRILLEDYCSPEGVFGEDNIRNVKVCPVEKGQFEMRPQAASGSSRRRGRMVFPSSEHRGF